MEMENTAAALPDDLVIEVLARVTDVTALFRCAMACMHWRGLITDRSFLRRRWPENTTHPSFLVGFFTQSPWCHGSEDDDEYVYDPDSPPVFILAPRSGLSRGLRLSSSTGLLHGATPLTARGGLLLVRLGPLDDFDGPLRLAVCDLLAGTCDVLPPLLQWQCEHKSTTSTSYALLTGEDCRSSDGQKPPSPVPEHSAFFKVVAVVLADDRYGGLEYIAHVFSSAEPGWATLPKLTGTALWPYMQRHAAMSCHGGMAHWLSGEGYPDDDDQSNILTIDTSIPEDGRASLTELSLASIEQPARRNCKVATVDGTLGLSCLRTEKGDLRLEIWAWRDDGKYLYLTKVIELKPPENKPLGDAFCLLSGEKSGTLLIGDSRPSIYVAYLQTGEIEEISSQLCDMLGDVVPIEMDWPSLFVSRLVGGFY